MKDKMKITVIGALVACGLAIPTQAQNLVQPLNVRLTAYDQSSATTVKKIRITNKDVINALNGTNVSRGQLLLVTPQGAGVGSNGNLSAFLRIKSGNTTILETTVDTFNVYQDYASTDTHGNNTTTYAINRFSLDLGIHSELQGLSTWHLKGANSTGSFNSTVNGHGTVDGVTQPADEPMDGTITGGAVKAGP
jgi:hypothetical protein